MIKLFGNKRTRGSKAQTASNGARMDGYSAQRARCVMEFQTIIEREIIEASQSGDTSLMDRALMYEALRNALYWARDNNHAVTMFTLRARYNDVLYAACQYAYSAR